MEISNLAGLERDKSMEGDSSSHLVRVFQEEVDASLTWQFVRWMQDVTHLPIFVKVRGPKPLSPSIHSCSRPGLCDGTSKLRHRQSSC